MWSASAASEASGRGQSQDFARAHLATAYVALGDRQGRSKANAIKPRSSEILFLNPHLMPTFKLFGEEQALSCDVVWCLPAGAPGLWGDS